MPGTAKFEFHQNEIERVASDLKLQLPEDLGNFFSSLWQSHTLPAEILVTADLGREWVLESTGQSTYQFRLALARRIFPNYQLRVIKIPDATPRILTANAMNDEDALLAKVRHNRLIDLFLGLTSYSLQNHFRTTVRGFGQVEIDEIYVGVNRKGQQFAIPVRASSGKEGLEKTQTMQDIACCEQEFPKLICRAISTQFLDDATVAMVELEMEDGEAKVVEERRYQLVPAEEIVEADLRSYAKRS